MYSVTVKSQFNLGILPVVLCNEHAHLHGNRRNNDDSCSIVAAD